MELKKAEHPWFALQIRTRYERVVVAHLDGKGYEWFLPEYKCRRRWSDRFKELMLPLFPGYLFCRFNPFDRLPILTIPGVIHVVGIGKNPIPIADSEVAAIQAVVASGLPSQPWPYMQIGETARIDAGPLTGLEGILLEVRGRHRLVLSVALLQRSVAVEIDSACVSPVHPQTGRCRSALAPLTLPGRALA